MAMLIEEMKRVETSKQTDGKRRNKEREMEGYR